MGGYIFKVGNNALIACENMVNGEVTFCNCKILRKNRKVIRVLTENNKIIDFDRGTKRQTSLSLKKGFDYSNTLTLHINMEEYLKSKEARESLINEKDFIIKSLDEISRKDVYKIGKFIRRSM